MRKTPVYSWTSDSRRLAPERRRLKPKAMPATSPTSREIPDPDESEFDARQLFISRKCEVRAVKDDRKVVLYDQLGRETHEIQLSNKVKLRAVSKKQFGGRKKLEFDDFAVGQRVKVNIRKSDGRILRIDVLPESE